MDARIEALLNRLPELEETEKKLRLESNVLAYPSLEDGEVKIIVTDPGRLAAIRSELDKISTERDVIEGKLSRLRELLGDSLIIPNPDRQDDYSARLRSTFATRFEGKICRGHSMILTPEEAIQTDEYKALRAEYQPRLDEIAARKTQDEETASAAHAILST